jgi:hypothetical protein
MVDWREDVVAALDADDCDAALDLMPTDAELCPADLLLKGRCIQHSRGETGQCAEDAVEAFKTALRLDPAFVPAHRAWLDLLRGVR